MDAYLNGIVRGVRRHRPCASTRRYASAQVGLGRQAVSLQREPWNAKGGDSFVIVRRHQRCHGSRPAVSEHLYHQ